MVVLFSPLPLHTAAFGLRGYAPPARGSSLLEKKIGSALSYTTSVDTNHTGNGGRYTRRPARPPHWLSKTCGLGFQFLLWALQPHRFAARKPHGRTQQDC